MYLSKKLLNIPKLLRNDGRSKQVNLEQPVPKPKEVVERPPSPSPRVLALQLDNYTPADYPLPRYNVGIDQKLQVDAFKVALRTAPEELDLADFTFQLDPNILDSEQSTIVPTESVDSDLTTIVEPDYISSNTKVMEANNVMSMEEIFSNVRSVLLCRFNPVFLPLLFKKHELIPALLLRYTDVIGGDRLAYQHDTAIYYDFCVDHIDHHVRTRGVANVPRAPDYAFFRKHAVRAFLQIPDVPNIENGPFYRPLGDYYINRTDDLLSQREWKLLPEYVKDLFVSRFAITHNAPPTDKYRGQNDYSPATARKLLDKGNIYPLVHLQRAYQKEEPIGRISPIMLNNKKLDFMQLTSVKSFDSESVYSQDSAARDDEDFYTSEANLDVPHSPLFTDPFGGNMIITFTDGAQEVYPATRCGREI
ncbi:hypothetical protein DXG01_008848 [Tephrocybe rancida]|nr:hypothetical protein DXG01_008848 [Tephrocybe rancida]